MQRYLVFCMALLAQVSADDCPGGEVCEEGNTCCKVPSDGYECCPMYQAECCEDHIHCCHEGTLCVVNESMCVNGTVSLPWLERVSAKQSIYPKSFRMISAYAGNEDDNICPDKSHCPEEFSCLKATTGYGCCPIAHAVPCSDGKHCCPEGHQCSTDCSSCIKQTEPVVAVMCSDRESECPEGTTCCETPDGSWGCCPMPKAVCCEDKIHCCPEGSTCDIKQSKCISTTNKEMPMWAKFPARKRAEWENQNEVSQMTTPIPDTTTSANRSPASLWEGTSPPFIRTGDVPCDESTACLDGTTCCKTQEGGWACCPLPQAVCCSDFVHCCPHGKKCNQTAQTCDDPSGSPYEPWLKKVPAVPREGKLPGDVTCDPTHVCPDNTTCCKTASGGWACCPLPEAVCCEDHEHCCPHGTTCDLAGLTCDGPSGSEPMVGKVPALTTLASDHEEAATDQQGVQVDDMELPTEDDKDVPCDESTACLDGTTCCKTQEGGWACCPLPQAVCCEDHEHCCPYGSTCDLATLTCDGPSGPEPMVVKVPTLTTQAPDHEEPPVDHQGVQMDDMELPTEDDDSDEDEELHRTQCDAHTSCPKAATCCFMKSTQKWGCCPLPQAVCCADGEHCCPKDYICDMSKTSCSKGGVVIPWYNKLAAEPDDSALTAPLSVKCDTQNRCPEGSSCCQLSTGQWGCCPLRKAVCCADEEHCCPQGYSCNMGSGTCQKLMFLQFQMVPLTRVSAPEPPTPQEKEIHCGGPFVCNNEETCCKVSATTWACCPVPNAVCCSDMKHCCTTGYTCGEGGSCTQSTGFKWDHWQVFFSNKKRALRV